jgi:hypothetical protein
MSEVLAELKIKLNDLSKLLESIDSDKEEIGNIGYYKKMSNLLKEISKKLYSVFEIAFIGNTNSPLVSYY